MKKERSPHYDSTVCYLIKEEKILMLQFKKKWGQVYAPPGGKFQYGESPTECILREFKEETNLQLEELKLKGISYWDYMGKEDGNIFFFTATKYEGELKESEEGTLKWIPITELATIKQFEMNTILIENILKEGTFEGKFLLKEDNAVERYEIKEM